MVHRICETTKFGTHRTGEGVGPVAFVQEFTAVYKSGGYSKNSLEENNNKKKRNSTNEHGDGDDDDDIDEKEIGDAANAKASFGTTTPCTRRSEMCENA